MRGQIDRQTGDTGRCEQADAILPDLFEAQHRRRDGHNDDENLGRASGSCVNSDRVLGWCTPIVLRIVWTISALAISAAAMVSSIAEVRRCVAKRHQRTGRTEVHALHQVAVGAGQLAHPMASHSSRAATRAQFGFAP